MIRLTVRLQSAATRSKPAYTGFIFCAKLCTLAQAASRSCGCDGTLTSGNESESCSA